MPYHISNSAVFTDSAGSLPIIPRERSCCFSGHRPENFPADKARIEYLCRLVADTAAILYYKGIDTFITGMARGFDLLAADTLVKDPDIGSKIHLICAVPYADHRREMKTAQEDMLYRKLIKRADLIVCLGDEYRKDCYKLRNSFMINNSSNLIAYLKDENSLRSGTGMTCNLARKAGHTLYMIYEKDLRG